MGRGARVSSAWGWLAGIPILLSLPIHAQDNTAASACRFAVVGRGQVVRVLDGRSFMLDGGREVRLAAVEVPSFEAADTGRDAKAGLEAILAGQTVELRNSTPATDRYRRIVVYVHVITDGMDKPVAHELLARGHARVSAQVGDAACAAELLTQERVARAQKLGLWAAPSYAIVAAGSWAELMAGRGRFTVAEGKVVSVRESGGTIYMNFGRRWSEALTVTISKRNERIFTAAGLTPKTLENRRVRVRGWIDERNGPRIEATRPEQIEVAELN